MTGPSCAAAMACIYGFLGQRRGDVFQIGYSQATPMNVSPNNGLSFIETLSNPFQGGILEPGGIGGRHRDLPRPGITYFDPNPESPQDQRWQVGMQRELGRRWVAEVRYVGQLRIGAGRPAATSTRLPNEFLSTSPARDQARNDYPDRAGAESVLRPDAGDGAAGFRGANIGRQLLLRPYPQFDASTRRPTRAVLVQRDAGAASTGGVTAATRSTSATRGRASWRRRVPQCRRRGADRNASRAGRSASAGDQRHLGNAIRTGPPIREQRESRCARQH